MKRYILLTFILLAFICVSAQSISVKSFRALPMDMTASSLEGKRIDQNGDVAALIKVVTTQTGFTFEGGVLGIVDTKQRNGEIWVWVPRASRKITILHQQLGVLRDYRYPIEIESERTYEMVLATGTVETIIKDEVRQQYLAFRISPNNATLFVNDELWEVGSDGSAVRFVNFGTYNYRVMAPNYLPETGTVTVNDPDNTQTVPVSLKPDFVEVTLKVDADAEIWVNNEKKGVRTWTGQLGKGTYKIECKKEGHETSMISKEITAEMNGKTITLPVPTPVYGSLNVESTPIGATIYIDGMEMGITPKSFNKMLVGQHELRLTIEGYKEHKEHFVVKKEDRTYLQVFLLKQTNIPPSKVSLTTNSGTSKGRLPGKYSVGPKKQVRFSRGNLQYQASTDTWRFAEHQWTIVGEENSNISQNNEKWIDLFGWGTSGYGDKRPYMSSTLSEDYVNGEYDIAGTNYDWGIYNAISNGGNKAGLWRTLTKDEWQYIFLERTTSSRIRYAKAIVFGVKGVVLLPDDWKVDYYELKDYNTLDSRFDSNIITSFDWMNKFENNGAVFLPAAGYRNETSVSYVDYFGNYWSTSKYEHYGAYYLQIGEFYNTSGAISTGLASDCYYGYSVRLVQDYNP